MGGDGSSPMGGMNPAPLGVPHLDETPCPDNLAVRIFDHEDFDASRVHERQKRGEIRLGESAPFVRREFACGHWERVYSTALWPCYG